MSICYRDQRHYQMKAISALLSALTNRGRVKGTWIKSRLSITVKVQTQD